MADPSFAFSEGRPKGLRYVAGLSAPQLVAPLPALWEQAGPPNSITICISGQASPDFVRGPAPTGIGGAHGAVPLGTLQKD